MRLDEDQQKGRNESGKNILVSAGAGAGKTTVLSERVIRILDEYVSENKKEKGNILRLLILTFTDNAASSMARKIKKTIVEKIEKEPDNLHLKEQLKMIDSAYITTFDSFYSKIAKKYFYKLGINKDFQIGSETIFYIELNKIIDKEFDRLYLENDITFLELLNKFTLKNDDDIKDLIISIVNNQNKVNSNETKLEEYLTHPIKVDFINKLYDSFYKDFYNVITNFSNLLDLDISNYNKYKKVIQYNKDVLTDYKNKHDFDELVKFYKEIQIPRIAGNSKETEADTSLKQEYNLIKDELKNKASKYLSILTKKDCLNLFQTNKKYYEFIYQLAYKVNKELDEFKLKNNLFTFADIQNKTVNLIINDKQVQSQLKNSFDEIMVDEYQDNNDIQEKLLEVISNNNLFMVGDVKQSIYGFRNSKPEYFSKRYTLYKNSEDKTKGVVIDMNNNYRSTSFILSSVNSMFRNLMIPEFGGINYTKEHLINAKNDNYNHLKNKLKPKIINYYSSKEDNEEIINGKKFKLTTSSKVEAEIEIVAQDIINRINNKEKIGFSSDDNSKFEGHEVSFKDFCILCKTTTKFDAISKVFKKYQIPLKIEGDENINVQQIVIVIKNIMLLYAYLGLNFDKRKDHFGEFKASLLSLLRSPLIKCDSKQLISTFLKDNKPNDNFDDVDIVKKFKNILIQYSNCDLYFVFNKIANELDLYSSIKDFYNPIISLVNIENYLEELKIMSKLNYNYEDIIYYYNKISKEDIKSKLKITNTIEDAVTLTNIHKSKGLEYNIVYCLFNFTKYNLSSKDNTSRNFYTNQTGLYLPYTRYDNIENEGSSKSPFDIYLTKINEDKIKQEEIRLFYVELTRPIFQYIFLNYKKEREITDINKCNSYSDLFSFSGYKFDSDSSIEIDVDNLNNKVKLNNPTNNIDKLNVKFTYKKLENVKYTTVKESETSSSKIVHQNKEIVEFGDKLHNILENISINNPNLSILENEDSKIKTIITNFLKSDLLKKYKDYKEYHEFEFYDEDNNSFGFMDLLLVGESDFVIIDYKLKNLDDSHYVLQLENYKKHAEKIFSKKGKCYLYSLIDSKYKEIC